MTHEFLKDYRTLLLEELGGIAGPLEPSDFDKSLFTRFSLSSESPRGGFQSISTVDAMGYFFGNIGHRKRARNLLHTLQAYYGGRGAEFYFYIKDEKSDDGLSAVFVAPIDFWPDN